VYFSPVCDEAWQDFATHFATIVWFHVFSLYFLVFSITLNFDCLKKHKMLLRKSVDIFEVYNASSARPSDKGANAYEALVK
jgi:hypothetical protein